MSPVKADKSAGAKPASAASGKAGVTTPQTGNRISRLAARRSHRVHLRRAREGRHHASGLPQHRPHGGAAVRRACTIPKHADKIMVPTDTGNGGKTHAFFKAPKSLDDLLAGTQRDRRMGEDHIRLARPLARLQGFVPGDARRQRAVLRSVQPTTRGAGTNSVRSACRSSITPSSIRRSTATGRRTKSPTSAAMSKKKPTPASSSPAPRWWPPARC